MKKIFVLTVIISLPAFALCPIDIDGESVCTMQNFNNNSSPLFNNQANNFNQPSQTNKMRPFLHEQTLEQNRFPQNNQMNNNSNCQFGTCLNDTKKEVKVQ